MIPANVKPLICTKQRLVNLFLPQKLKSASLRAAARPKNAANKEPRVMNHPQYSMARQGSSLVGYPHGSVGVNILIRDLAENWAQAWMNFMDFTQVGSAKKIPEDGGFVERGQRRWRSRDRQQQSKGITGNCPCQRRCININNYAFTACWIHMVQGIGQPCTHMMEKSQIQTPFSNIQVFLGNICNMGHSCYQ